MKGWIEIFKSGQHTSSNGVAKTWTTGDLDKMVKNYGAAEHEAPVVVGHPRANDPAYGWLQKVKRTGDTLLGKFHQVAPEFTELVKEGRFKKRSISVYPDGTIRHIGFLGAQPPAVKGLKDITFSDDTEAITYEYNENTGEEANMTELEKLQKKLDEEKRLRKEAEDKAGNKEKEAKKSAASFAELQKKMQRKGIENFIEAGIKDGKILPAWKDKGLADFMDGLESQEETFEFAEGKKQTRAQWFKEFISSFSEHPLFKEMVKPEDNKKKEADDFAEDEKAAEEMAAAHQVK